MLSSTAKVDSPLPPVMVKVSGSLSASDATIVPTSVPLADFSCMLNVWFPMLGASLLRAAS